MPKHTKQDAAEGDFEEVSDSKETDSSDLSFENQVNAATKDMVQDDDGLWQLPDDSGLSEEVVYAAKLEKRRRDTQSTLAKTSQELGATKTRANKLETKLKESFVPQLTDDEAEEMEDLKSSDPEAYRLKMNEYEERASDAFEEELAELGFDEEQVTEMATRAEVLTNFLDDNPGLTLDDEVFENDLPPRITSKLEKGEISFEDFLEEAKGFLTKGNKIANTEDDDDDPDLSKTGGSSNASDKAIKGDSEQSYLTEVY